MNILVLEDRGSVSFYLEEALKNEGYLVFSAVSILDAQSYWESKQIDCIVVDSNMNPDGLTQEEIKKTQGGLLSGCMWLQNYVFAKNEDMKARTIIYTEYLEQLRSSKLGKLFEDVCMLSKRDSTSPAEQLLTRLRGIARMTK